MAEEHSVEPDDWPRNYFNYFTEVEERFREARGTGLFLLSPLDWALVEAWKESGVPLLAVLRGIDAAFQKWRSRKQRSQAVNSLAYCAQAVAKEAQILAGAAPGGAVDAKPPFSMEELQEYLLANARHLRSFDAAVFLEIAQSLELLAAEVATHFDDLEDLERRLTALEEKMIAAARLAQSEADLLNARRDLDYQLRPYRSKMSAEQLAMLERQFLDRRLLEDKGLRRLSLYYLAGA